MTFSRTMLPPILNYSYSGFRYESDTGGSVTVELPALLSITNDVSQIDHIQMRVVSMNSNARGLNATLFPQNIYFIKFDPALMSSGSGRNFKILFNTKLSGQSIFSIAGEAPQPSYYRIQVRVKQKGSSNYDPSQGQDPSAAWMESISSELSEWSNSAIVKTVKKPEVGMFNLTQDVETVLEKPDYIFQGYYTSNDENEPLVKYNLSLYKNGRLVEDGEVIYIKEYETPYISYKFREIFVNDVSYIIALNIETGSGYQYTTYYPLSFNLGFTKLYNIFTVDEDSEGARNIVSMFPKQIQLVSSIPEDSLVWLEDNAFDQFGEEGINHLYLDYGIITTPQNFNIPYEDFTILFAITGLEQKVSTSAQNAINSGNLILSATSDLSTTTFKVGLYRREDGPFRFFLQETGSGLVQYHFADFVGDIGNKEFIFMIKKHQGDTVFKAQQWLVNAFE